MNQKDRKFFQNRTKKKKVPKLLFFKILVCIIINHIWDLLYHFPNPITELRTNYQNLGKTRPPITPDYMIPVRQVSVREKKKKPNKTAIFFFLFQYFVFLTFVADLASFADTWKCSEVRRQFWFSLKKLLFFSSILLKFPLKMCWLLAWSLKSSRAYHSKVFQIYV